MVAKGKCGAESRRRQPDSRNSETQEWGSWNSPLRLKRQSGARAALYIRESCEMHERVRSRSRLGGSVNRPNKADLLKLKANQGKSRQLKLDAAHGHQSKGRETGGAQDGRRKNAGNFSHGWNTE